jgi:hypothetical protein
LADLQKLVSIVLQVMVLVLFLVSFVLPVRLFGLWFFRAVIVFSVMRLVSEKLGIGI